MIHVVAVITAKSGKRGELLTAFHSNVPNVLAEDGCVEYQPVTDAEDAGAFQSPLGPATFIVIEKWATLDALKAHTTAPHMVDYAAKAAPLIADRAIHVLKNAG